MTVENLQLSSTLWSNVYDFWTKIKSFSLPFLFSIFTSEQTGCKSVESCANMHKARYFIISQAIWLGRPLKAIVTTSKIWHFVYLGGCRCTFGKISVALNTKIAWVVDQAQFWQVRSVVSSLNAHPVLCLWRENLCQSVTFSIWGKLNSLFSLKLV